MRPRSTDVQAYFSANRLRIWYGLLLIVFAIFIVRLFYLQVIRHDYYKRTALSGQLKEYEIPAERGVIEAHDGSSVVPIVLNEEVYTLFADPVYIEDASKTAQSIQAIIGGDAKQYESAMKTTSRYAVLAKNLSKGKSEKLNELKIKGLGTRATPKRTYPQGGLAAQVLGFVNDEGKGVYGIEQSLNDQLAGKPGELKAITDASGVPLLAAGENVLRDPVPGKRTLLTIDISMQRRLEDMLKSHLEKVRSKSGSVIIMDPNNGSIKAMANYPSYNPSEFSKVSDPGVFTNAAVSAPLEVGSIMKALTVAAGLDSGSISANSGFFDPAKWEIDGHTVRNVEEDGGPQQRSLADILSYSLNTGATWVLMQMGGGEINEKARVSWHDYMTNHYQLGKKTGIEQGYEAEGSIPSPTEGFGLNIQYANTTFGQGMTATPLQMAAAFSATINGGTYYRPHLVDTEKGKAPDVVKSNVVSSQVSDIMRGFHENSVQTRYAHLKRDGYKIGGKTGTAEVPKPDGGYYNDRYNGTFIGYVGGNKPQYVIIVRINEPNIGGYAGSAAAAPMFGLTMDMLIQNYGVNKAH